MAKRTLQELTIGNNFMFGAVMCDEENCKGLIEMVIGTPIDRIEVSKEKAWCIIRNTRVSVSMSMRRMKRTPIITLKCK